MASQAPTPFLTLRNSIDSKIDVIDFAGHFVLRHAYMPFDGTNPSVTTIILSDEEADNFRSYVHEQRPGAKKPTIQ